MAARVNRGRRRISLQRIENEARRSVTFSKRKSNVLKKSNELCTLTSAEMAVMIRSGNKIFSFGIPYVQAIVDRFLLVNPEPLANPSATDQVLGNFRTIELDGLNMEYNFVDDELLNCRQQGEVLTRTGRVCQAGGRYKRSLENMGSKEIESFETDLIKLHGIVAQRSEELQHSQAHLMNQDVAVEVGSGFENSMPPSAVAGGPFHEGSSLNHMTMRSDSTSFFWHAI